MKWCNNWELGETDLCPAPRVFKEASLPRGGLSYGRFELRTGLHNKRGLLAGAKACLEAEPTRLRTTAYKPAASPCIPCSPRRRGCFLQVCGYLGDPCQFKAEAAVAVYSVLSIALVVFVFCSIPVLIWFDISSDG